MKIAICVGSCCHLEGSRKIVEDMQTLIAEHGLEERVELSGRFCMGDCQNGVCLTVDGQKFSLRPGDVPAFFAHEVLGKVSVSDGKATGKPAAE